MNEGIVAREGLNAEAPELNGLEPNELFGEGPADPVGVVVSPPSEGLVVPGPIVAEARKGLAAPPPVICGRRPTPTEFAPLGPGVLAPERRLVPSPLPLPSLLLNDDRPVVWVFRAPFVVELGFDVFEVPGRLRFGTPSCKGFDA